MKKFLGVLLILVLALSACGRPAVKESNTDQNAEGTDGEKFKIRIAHLVKDEVSGARALVSMKEKIEERSDGKVEVEIFSNGKLFGSDREAIEAVQLGNVEMTVAALAPIVSFNDKFMVFDLPFLFKSKEAAYSALDGELGQSLLDSLEANSLKGIAYAENGFRHMTNNKRPIETPDDLKGLKMRTLENPLHTDTFKAFGANASPFSFGELYTALQQNTYDAMEAPISLIYTNKFYEVQKYLTLSGHVYAPGIMVMNNDFFNSMPEDLQTIVLEEAEKAKVLGRELGAEEEVIFFDKLKEEGIKVNELSDEQKEVFREKAKPVYDKYVPKIGQELVDKALDANKE
ncbi:C4-dicarboxylate ABC transporter substrate-binding protein [Sporosarcina sp. PTS2304]|uniref:TRAP transporter substrate-binding protein n=1 Tax=Sporosarcina sp. PTS2304 TaxID=2283194 RepID=UPI000E0CFAFF|nr:DctP family TRAP transporter solute-binding subunit [Sporosarcina sp. PTS2304]AXI00030.1 C4-dicarboxylate ABC transporter substrate-binding protein [Sporosarcina sp. PTS2304]